MNNPETANTSFDLAYVKAMRNAAERHAKSGEERISHEQEQELAAIIQKAKADLDVQPDIRRAQSPRREVDELNFVIYLRALPQDSEARRALDILVESHLEYATQLARSSMGLGMHEDDEQPTKVVERIAELRSPGAVLTDRIQAANLGLIDAALHFKPGYIGRDGEVTKFTTYAAWRIYRSLRRHAGGSAEEPALDIRADRRYKIKAELADWDNLSRTRQQELRQLESLQNPLNIDDAEEPQAPNDTFEEVAQRIFDVTLKEVLDTLSERERKVIVLYFGLEGETPLTSPEIGQQFGVTSERIRQIRKRAPGKLQSLDRADRLRAFMYENYDDTGGEQ